MEDDLMEMALEAHKRSFQRAFETAVRTGTALVFFRNGKVVEIKPPIDINLLKSHPKRKNQTGQECQNNLKSTFNGSINVSD